MRITPARKQVLKLLRKKGGCTTARVMYDLNLRSGQYGNLQAMADAGLVRKTLDGGWANTAHWHITNAGRAALAGVK